MADDSQKSPRGRIVRLGPGELPPVGAVPVAEGRFGLLVPPHLAPDADVSDRVEREGMIRFTLSALGWSALTGEVPTVAQVLDRLQGYSLIDITAWIAQINLLLERERRRHGPFVSLQRHLEIVAGLTNPGFARQLLDAARRQHSDDFDPSRIAIFDERQTLNALKLGFLSVDVGIPATVRAGQALVEALLMLNDLIHPTSEETDISTAEGRSRFELYLAATMLFNPSPHDVHGLVRAHHLFVESRPDVVGTDVIDLPSQLERVTGLTAETTWRALYALTAFWRALSQGEIEAGRTVIRRSEYLATLTCLTDSERDRWFALAVRDAVELQDRVRRDYSITDPRYFDVLAFAERPLIEFEDRVFCSSFSLLRRLPTDSFQYRYLDQDAFSSSERAAFLRTRGRLVEKYTADALSRAFGDRFIPEHRLQAAAPDHQVCDGVILYPDAVVLVECKTTSPSVDVRHAVNYATYRATWERTVRRAGDQLESTIQLLSAGAFKGLGVDPELVREIFPVIGVFELPVEPATYHAIRVRDLAGHPLAARMDAGNTRPLQLLTIREVELVERLSERGRSFVEILRAKTRDAVSTGMPLLNFLYDHDPTALDGHSTWHMARFEEITKAARDYFRDLGMPVGETGEDATTVPGT